MENGDFIAILNHIIGKWFYFILNHISDGFWIPCLGLPGRLVANALSLKAEQVCSSSSSSSAVRIRCLNHQCLAAAI
jgi:hypothetical protein